MRVVEAEQPVVWAVEEEPYYYFEMEEVAEPYVVAVPYLERCCCC